MTNGMTTEEVEQHVKERYEIQKRLGKGAYGIVWKAVDRRNKEIVALKKVRAPLSSKTLGHQIFDAFRNATDSQRTFREVMFLQEFGRHPNIIKLYNIIRAENDKWVHLGKRALVSSWVIFH